MRMKSFLLATTMVSGLVAAAVFPAKLVNAAGQASVSEIQVDCGCGRSSYTVGADWDWLGSLAFVAHHGLTAPKPTRQLPVGTNSSQ